MKVNYTLPEGIYKIKSKNFIKIFKIERKAKPESEENTK